MKKLFLVMAFIATGTSITYAQDNIDVSPTKKLNHTIGVQMNELVRQVFNFNNSTATNLNNPYLLIYSINMAKSGWGLRVGAGYNYQNFTDDDGITKNTTDNSMLNARLGIEKAFNLSGKFSAGIGVDGIYSLDDNKTVTVVRSFDSTTTTIKSKISSIGGGAMGWLRYNVTPNIQIGTETSFYYKTGNREQNIKNVVKRGNIGGSTTITESKIDNKESEGVFRVPVVFYLAIKF